MIKIKLRTKQISGNRESLYLEYYPAVSINGKLTRYEFLRAYLYQNPSDKFQKQQNKVTLEIANGILQKRFEQYNKTEIYTNEEKEKIEIISKGNISFIDIAKKIANKQKKSTQTEYLVTIKKFTEYIKGKDIKLNELTPSVINSFIDYLTDSGNKQNTIKKRLAIVKAVLVRATKKGLYSANWLAQTDTVKKESVTKTFLTIDELQLLANTDCENEQVKRAALFSALTGLRFSDIKTLKPTDITKDSDTYICAFKAIKTAKVQYIPISELAVSLISPNSELAFKLPTNPKTNKVIKNWIQKAGIVKKITFHSFRHSFATLQLASGTDITTIKELLGHSDLATTMVYAKVIDEKKIQATKAIKLDL